MIIILRKCKINYWTENDEFKHAELGYFHQWINDINTVIALVELPNGTVVKVNPSDLEFLDTKEYCEFVTIPDKELTEKEIKNLMKNKGAIMLCQN